LTQLRYRESQTVQNTLTEHRMHFKNERGAGNGAYALKGTTSRVMVTIGPKLLFDQMAAPALEIMDDYVI
jgi:hypothetical protein